MEKEGLDRVIQSLEQQDLSISVLVTDRHRQINRWLRECHPDIKHYYDVCKGKYGIQYYSLDHIHVPLNTTLVPQAYVRK